MIHSSYAGEKEKPLDEGWHADGSSNGMACKWTKVIVQPNMDVLWLATETGMKGQWAILCTIGMFMMHSGHLHVCMNNWVILSGLILWMLARKIAR